MFNLFKHAIFGNKFRTRDGMKVIYWYMLDDNGIKYEKVDHMPVFTMEEMVTAGITKNGEVIKNLFLSIKSS